MNRLGAIVARLAFASEPDDQLRLLTAYLAALEPEEREVAARMLAEPPHARRIRLSALKNIAREQVGEELFDLSSEFVGDAAETVALLWTPSRQHNRPPSPQDLMQGLADHGPSKLQPTVQSWLDACDPEGRHLVIRIVTGSLRPPAPRHVLLHAFELSGVNYRPVTAPTTEAAARQSDLFRTDVAPKAGSIIAVLLYVHRPARRNDPLMCTFGVWHDGALVPVGKASAAQVSDTIVRHMATHTIRRFGPTTHVTHSDQLALLLHVTFEGVTESRRHKAGLTLQGATIRTILPSHALDDVGSLEELMKRLPQFQPRG